jgi:hypothetical protein
MTPFTAAESRLVARLASPAAVQAWLHRVPYNYETRGETLRSLRGVLRHRTAHCLEAALAAAAILEPHGYPPLLLTFESVDLLDHVLYLFRERGRWGAIARSRDPGLQGRRPAFATPRALARSYLEPYVDLTGRIKSYAVADLRELGGYDWRLSSRNVWKVERWLVDYEYEPLTMPDRLYDTLHQRYQRFKARHPDRKPRYYTGRDWSG